MKQYLNPVLRLTLGAFLLLSSAVLSAQAASLQISPTSLRFDLPQPRAGSLTLSNPSSEPVTVSVELSRWTQAGGEDQFAPTQDVLVNPARFVVPPNGSQIIRVGWRSKALPGSEQAYRMTVQNVPGPSAAGEGIKVQVVLKMNVPLLFTSPTAQPKVSWTLMRQGDQVQLSVQNSGAHFASFNNVTLMSGDYKASVGSFAVLSGGLLSFTLSNAVAALRGGTAAQISYDAQDKSKVGERETLTLALP